MRIDGVLKPKSSFLSIEKDMGIISNEILKNERLKRLLYYNSPDALKQPNLTEEQSIELFGKNIKNIPKLYVDEDVRNYIFIGFDNFSPNYNNPQFRDNVIAFDIVCHFDQWQLKDFKLRPYRIAAEIDSMFNDTHLTGIGTLQFMGAKKIVLSSEFAGICLMYEAIHGEEDKTPMLNPVENREFREEYIAQYS